MINNQGINSFYCLQIITDTQRTVTDKGKLHISIPTLRNRIMLVIWVPTDGAECSCEIFIRGMIVWDTDR